MKTISENAESIFAYEYLGIFYGKDNIIVIMGEKSIVYYVKDFKVSFPKIDKDNILNSKEELKTVKKSTVLLI